MPHLADGPAILSEFGQDPLPFAELIRDEVTKTVGLVIVATVGKCFQL